MRVALALAWCMFVPGEAWAYAYSAQSLAGVVAGQTEGEPVVWRSPREEIVPTFGSGFDESAAAAMAEWSSLGSFALVMQPAGGGDPCDGDDNQNVASWRATMCDGMQFGDALAATTRTYVRLNNRYYLDDAGIFFDSARHWSPRQFGPLIQDHQGLQVYDFYRVMLHELGHALGLDHPDMAGQDVVAIMNSRAGRLDTLQADDKNGYQRLYGAAAVPAPGGSASASQQDGGGGGGGAWGLAALAAVAFPRRNNKEKGSKWKKTTHRKMRRMFPAASK